jgi:hypothetical protein
MLRIKHGVDLNGLRPEMTLALQIAAEAYKQAGFDCWVTSAHEGVHSPGSLHYVGLAVDLRTESAGIARTKARALTAVIRAALSVQYDVVAESRHIHIEFQPKVKT